MDLGNLIKSQKTQNLKRTTFFKKIEYPTKTQRSIDQFCILLLVNYLHEEYTYAKLEGSISKHGMVIRLVQNIDINALSLQLLP